MKAATESAKAFVRMLIISIHAAREGGDTMAESNQYGRLDISIHAAREGGDCLRFFFFQFVHISIHAAREGGDG